jgi:hypothetical protein
MTAFIANSLLVPLIQALIAATVFAGAVLLGCGLLAGWNWTRWVMLVLSGVVTLACLGGCVALVYTAASMNLDPDVDKAVVGTEKKPVGRENEQADAGTATPFKAQNFLLGMVAMYSVPLLLVLICAATSFVSLLLPSTGAWFRMADQARREHRALVKSLGD